MTEKNIPIFFSCDDNYIPFLGVAIKSLIENSSKNNNYYNDKGHFCSLNNLRFPFKLLHTITHQIKIKTLRNKLFLFENGFMVKF